MSQANPVSTTLYTVLDTTKNVRIISATVKLTWATTQPNPLEMIVIIDGRTLTFVQPNPISTGEYEAVFRGMAAETAQTFYIWSDVEAYRRGNGVLLEGRSVKIQVRVTWATTQPTPLECRVIYAKIP